MRKKDLIIIARLDHSIQIYNELLKQNNINFLYITFRAFHKSLSFITKHISNRVTYVSKHSKILFWPTIVSILNQDLGLNYFKNKTNFERFEKAIPKILNKRNAKIIHYWPEYSSKAISQWKTKHPNSIFIADVYYPNPSWVITQLESIYKKYNIEYTSYLLNYAKQISNQLKDADYVLVASDFMVETLKQTFPDKRYIVVSYGISKSPLYKFKQISSPITNFAYVGAVRIEKGVDLLLECFMQRPDLNLHLFGSIRKDQEFIFEKYNSLPNIKFHGVTAKSDIQKMFDEEIHVGIHLSRFDAYSLAVSEELGAGLPVIVSNVTGIASDVRNYDWGKVVDISNEDEILNAINHMCDLDNHNRYKRNINDYLSSPDINTTYGQKMVELYGKLLAEKI